MNQTKKEIITEVVERIEKLPENKQSYVIGVMNGLLISYKQEKQAKESVM